VRRAAAAKGAQRKVATAKKQTGNVIDGVMQWLPFSEETLHRIVLAVILGVAAMLVWVVASMAGVPMLAQEKLAQVASGAGFEVKRVEVRGVNRMNELKIYERCWASAISRCPGSISMGCAVI
jgi:cell division protein FtsQ